MCDDQLNKIENVIKVTSRNFSLSQKISTCDLYFLSSRGSHFPSFFYFFLFLRSCCISPDHDEALYFQFHGGAIAFPQFITKLLHFPSSRRSCCIFQVYDKAVVFQVHDDAVVFPQFMTKLVFPQFMTKLMFPKFATKLLYFPS